MLDKNCELFKSLSDSDIKTLTQLSKLKVLDKNQYLCTQHNRAEFSYIIATGSAAVERIFNDGRRQILSFLFPGYLVGVYNSDLFEFGVKSLEPLTAHQFPNDKLNSLAEEMPILRENMLGIRDSASNMMFDQIYLLGQKKAHERICYLLTQLLERMPETTPEMVELPMTRLDIADHLGLTVETVSRSMTKLKQEKLIDITGPHSVSIIDLDTVKQLGDIG